MKITVCGSIAFYPEMEQHKIDLERLGHEVLIPRLALEVPEEYGGGNKVYFGQYIEQNGGIDAFPPIHKLWDLKESAINDHFEKVEWCDAILVANHEKRGVEGYMGGNTLIEVGLAFYLRKKIFILNPISSDISYKQEIYGMKPVLLGGQIALISGVE